MQIVAGLPPPEPAIQLGAMVAFMDGLFSVGLCGVLLCGRAKMAEMGCCVVVWPWDYALMQTVCGGDGPVRGCRAHVCVDGASARAELCIVCVVHTASSSKGSIHSHNCCSRGLHMPQCAISRADSSTCIARQRNQGPSPPHY